MANEWRRIALRDVLSFANGKTSPGRSDGLRNPVYGSNGVIGFASETNAPENTIVIGRVGSYCGSLYLSKQKCWVTDNAIRASALNGNDARFLFYLLGTLGLNHWRAGSGQPLLNQTILGQIPASVPIPDEQRAIAQILGALDDKIELNRRMNETLEAMARSIFKAWFVDFDPVRAKAEGRQPPGLDSAITALFPDRFEDSEAGELPKGWRISTIRELSSNIQYGLTQSASTEPVGPQFLRITDIQGGRVDWSTVPYCKVSAEEHERYRLKPGDVLVARTGASTGENIYLAVAPDAVFASYLVRFQFADPAIARLVGAFMRSAAYFDFVAGSIGGSAQPNASAQVLAGAELVVPPAEIVRRFANIVAPIDNRMAANNDESRTLAAIRDLLLPKLMSGEIRVKDVEKHGAGRSPAASEKLINNATNT